VIEVWHSRNGIVARTARAVEFGPDGENLVHSSSRKRCLTAFTARADLPAGLPNRVALCAFTAAGNDRFTAVGHSIKWAGQANLAWRGLALVEACDAGA
jgi:hypothetical protein